MSYNSRISDYLLVNPNITHVRAIFGSNSYNSLRIESYLKFCPTAPIDYCIEIKEGGEYEIIDSTDERIKRYEH